MATEVVRDGCAVAMIDKTYHEVVVLQIAGNTVYLDKFDSIEDARGECDPQATDYLSIEDFVVAFEHFGYRITKEGE